MMLSGGDLLLILGTAAVCTAVTTVLALVILRRLRQRSVTAPFVVLVVAAVASIVCSTVAISALMYLSLHDLQVMLWVVGLSALLSLAATIVTARAVSRSFAQLGQAVERVGHGVVVGPEAYEGRELADLSAQLAVASERLAAARAEIEQLDAARRQFFAWISHDLRTPLTGVSALAEALDDGAVADPADYVRRIRAQVGTMNRLVDDLFALSQIQSGALRLRPEDIELLDVVSDAVADVHSLAVAKEIRIEHAGVEGRTLRADPHELTRVVVNLLTNSIRHAPHGSEILVSADRAGDRLVLSVLDQGSGVDSEDLTRMFEIGWRASEARTPDARPVAGSPGAGLGLAIVRGIVQAHGGDVRAEHVPQGFRLDVALPAPAI
ncbi:sensor histidine kinase [Promicromonospora sukumoe]|uniref:sensor histidine kinase n=1 Tax=Promicromonospora sukumoe TaxID=88382 RepID=UPI00035CD859|nr:HAMP domain-containing sensor histidine kinase [Promicromonospora sukumoe]